jgi:fructose-bisphosphate aldolase class I
MSTNNIEEIASYIVSEGKGILAADESNPTCGKRFDSIGVESTENNRRDYREMLFRASGMKDNIGGRHSFLMKQLDKMLKMVPHYSIL